MKTAQKDKPNCIIITGPNGAGKATFARTFQTKEAGVLRSVNADLIATGLSPLAPERAMRAAGRFVLKELGRITKAKEPFALESMLSGKACAKHINTWNQTG